MFHQPFYSQSQRQQHGQNNFFMPSYYRSGPKPNQSSQNLKFSRDFERFNKPSHGFSSMSAGPYQFYDGTNQQRWKQNMSRFHFQDKSTFYYMSDPIITPDKRITIQLTKVHIGPNGDQQRVFVEQEFSNENQLKKIMNNLRQNFEKTFNNRATGVQDSNEDLDKKKPGVIVVEEPDEEPIIYDQQVYNENIQSKQTTNNKSPSGSTTRSNKRRRNKMKYRRQTFNDGTYQQENQYRYYQQPPRFYQRFYNKENDSRMRTDFSIPRNPNNHWKFNGYQNRSRSYIPPINENYPPQTRFTHPKGQPPRFNRPQQQQQQQRRNQPRTIGENLIFTNNKQQQMRVERTRSECRLKAPIRNQSKINQYIDHKSNINQRHFIPFIFPSTPIFNPQRRLFRNIQVQFRLSNNSNRF